MQEVFDFIFSHYEAILSVLMLIISIVILIIRKKPVDTVFTAICLSALQCVKVAETTDLKGIEKLNYCVSLIKKDLKMNYPDINVSSYYGLIVKVVEDILSTPQKKGDK